MPGMLNEQCRGHFEPCEDCNVGIPLTDTGSMTLGGEHGDPTHGVPLPWYGGNPEQTMMPTPTPELWLFLYPGRHSMLAQGAPQSCGPRVGNCKMAGPNWQYSERSHRTSSRPVYPAPKFAGTSDFLVFKQHFEWASRLNSWTYREVAHHLACSLTGMADDSLSEVSQAEQLNDYDHLIHVLVNWLKPDDRTDYYHSEFRSLVQHPDKNATFFGHALKQIGPGAYPTFLPVEVEKANIEQFIDGLLNDQMHCHLWLQKPTMLEHCCILAWDVKQCYILESQITTLNMQPMRGKKRPFHSASGPNMKSQRLHEHAKC